MQWPKPTIFDAENTASWVLQTPVELPKPDFADNEELKKAYGIALGQGLDAFKAGMLIFEDAVAKALWVSTNWKNDPLVIATRDAYIREQKKASKPLDKEELLEEVLTAAQIAPEFKDKASLFKLYSEIAGYTGKVAEQLPASNTTNNNYTKIVLVGGSQQRDSNSPEKIINANPKSEISNNLPKLKLVSGR